MLSRISHNWTLKLTALIISVALWSHVRGQVNPWENANFKVRLRAEAPRGFLLLHENELPRTLVVTLRGPRLALRGLKGPAPANPLATGEDVPLLSPSQLNATLDFSTPRKGEQRVPIKVQSQIEDVEVLAVRPEEVVVFLDVAEKREFNIRPQVTADSDLEVVQIQQNFRMTTVSGPSNLLDRVARVRAVVPRSKLKAGVLRLANVPLQAIDRAGNTLPAVFLEPAQVNLQIQVREKPVVKSVRVAVEIVGAPASGYEVDATEVTPTRVTLRGPRRVVSELENVTATLNINGATEMNSRLITVDVPRGVEIVDGRRVRVRVEIEPVATASPPASTPAIRTPSRVAPSSATRPAAPTAPRAAPVSPPRPRPAPKPTPYSDSTPTSPVVGSFPLRR